MPDAHVAARARPPSLRRDVLSGLGAWAVLVALVGVGGILARARYGWWYRFDLDQEQTLPAWVSAVALVLAGARGVRAARAGVAGAPPPVGGALLIALGIDEGFGLH